MSKVRSFYGWKLVGAAASMDFLNLGMPFYIGAVINPYMLQHISMSRGTFGLGSTLLNLFVGIPSTLVAISIVKYGIRATYLIGSAFVCAGSLFLAFATTRPWQFLLGFGVINGIGVCFGDIIPGSTAAARWFERYRGRAVGLVLSGSGVCGFFMAPEIDKFLRANNGNWHLGWEIVAAGAVLSGIVALLFVKERPEDLGQLPDGGPQAPPGVAQSHASSSLVTKYEWTPSEAYRTRGYWLVVLAGLAAQFPFFVFVAHWLLHLQNVGVPSGDAAFSLGLFTVACIAGRLIGGWLVDTMAARWAFTIGLCCYLLGSLAALHAGPGALLIANSAAVLYGLGIGWTFTCMTTCIAHFYGPSAFPKLAGTLLLFTSGGASPAGWVGGKIFDMYGGYARAWQLNIAITVIGIVAILFATMPRHSTESSTVARVAA
ncbi:MAG TPA: MFS transporter [Candidatus Acidoferrum sp.]|nr:MFS transporter [Candidatus Acidoferrum sp.]